MNGELSYGEPSFPVLAPPVADDPSSGEGDPHAAGIADPVDRSRSQETLEALEALSTTRVQPRWRLHHQGTGRLAMLAVSELRDELRNLLRQCAAGGDVDPLVRVATYRGRSTLDMSALDPVGAAWMIAHARQILGAMSAIQCREDAAEPGGLLTVEAASEHPGVDRFLCSRKSLAQAPSHAPAGRRPPVHLYRIHSLVTATGGGWKKRGRACVSWEPWKAESLGATQRDELRRLIVDGLMGALSAWSGRSSAELADRLQADRIELIDAGRPMVIVPGGYSRSGCSPRGIARLDVCFTTPWRLSGDHYVGRMRQQGYGRVRYLGIQAGEPLAA